MRIGANLFYLFIGISAIVTLPSTQLQHHLSLPPHYSSSSPSQSSDTIGTPPTEIMMYLASSSNVNGKRPSSSNNMDSRKKARKDDDSETQSPLLEIVALGSYLLFIAQWNSDSLFSACTVCSLKMKCVGAEQGPPCKRCSTGNHECIFEGSNRGKRSSK